MRFMRVLAVALITMAGVGDAVDGRRSELAQGDHLRAAVHRERLRDHAALGAHPGPAREGPGRQGQAGDRHRLPREHRGAQVQEGGDRTPGAEVLRGGLEQQLRQRGADRPAPARQRLARLPLLPDRALGVGPLQPRGHGRQDLRVQRSELDLRLPGAVGHVHDGDGRGPEEATSPRSRSRARTRRRSWRWRTRRSRSPRPTCRT